MPQQFATQGTITSRLSGSKDRLIDDSKGAVQQGMELVAGQAALSVIRSFIVPVKLSFLDRVTGKGVFIKRIVDSAYGSLAIAATAHVLVTIIAPNNAKLHRICQLALNAAVVEAAATLPIQEWTDRLASKLFSTPAVSKILGSVDSDDKA